MKVFCGCFDTHLQITYLILYSFTHCGDGCLVGWLFHLFVTAFMCELALSFPVME